MKLLSSAVSSLAFIILFPFLGAFVLLKHCVRALWEERVRNVAAVKNVVLFLLAPIISLLYLILFPIVGIIMLMWMSRKGHR